MIGKHGPELQNNPVGNMVAPGKPVLYHFNFTRQSWHFQKLPDSPAIGHGSLLAMHGKQLIVYGMLLFRFPIQPELLTGIGCKQVSALQPKHITLPA